MRWEEAGQECSQSADNDMLSRGARVRELQGTRGDQCTTVQSKVLQKGRPVHLSTRGRSIFGILGFMCCILSGL